MNYYNHFSGALSEDLNKKGKTLKIKHRKSRSKCILPPLQKCSGNVDNCMHKYSKNKKGKTILNNRLKKYKVKGQTFNGKSRKTGKQRKLSQ